MSSRVCLDCGGLLPRKCEALVDDASRETREDWLIDVMSTVTLACVCDREIEEKSE